MKLEALKPGFWFQVEDVETQLVKWKHIRNALPSLQQKPIYPSFSGEAKAEKMTKRGLEKPITSKESGPIQGPLRDVFN